MASLPQGQTETESVVQPPLACPEGVDWIFEVDSLQSAGSEALLDQFGLKAPANDCPHHPFELTAHSATIWDSTIRSLSMAAGEKHILVNGFSRSESREITFYCRVAGFREAGLPKIAGTFQRIEPASYMAISEDIRENWLYLLHEIKQPLALFKTALDNLPDSPEARSMVFALEGLQAHLRNGVYLATEDSRLLPNRPEPGNLKSFFDQVKEAYTPLLEQHGVSFNMELDIDSFEQACFDRTLLSQIITNILLQKLSVLRDTPLYIACHLASSRADGGGVLLHILVRDEGPPFTEDILQQRDLSPDMEGMFRMHDRPDLGLSLCRRIAATMGGDIHFYNDPPGTRIRIIIPLG